MASTPLTRLSQALPKQKGPRFALALAAVLVLRSRLLELPQEVLAGVFERTARKHKLSPEELSETLQKLYVKEEDGRKMLLVPHREGVSKVRLRKFCDPTPFPSLSRELTETWLQGFWGIRGVMIWRAQSLACAGPNPGGFCTEACRRR